MFDLPTIRGQSFPKKCHKLIFKTISIDMSWWASNPNAFKESFCPKSYTFQCARPKSWLMFSIFFFSLLETWSCDLIVSNGACKALDTIWNCLKFKTFVKKTIGNGSCNNKLCHNCHMLFSSKFFYLRPCICCKTTLQTPKPNPIAWYRLTLVHQTTTFYKSHYS